MIEHILQPLVCERFKNDAKYRDGHLRVVNALPSRRVLGLHSLEMKLASKQISQNGCDIFSYDGKYKHCTKSTDVIEAFENIPSENLCYEETVIWGYLINNEKCTLETRLRMLARYIPVLDNWAVCDSYCAHAKWMQRADKETLWEFLQKWFESKREFEVRFAIVAAMTVFLCDEWLDRVFQRIENINFDRIKSSYKCVKGKPQAAQQGTVQGKEPYYVRMAAAWLMATALAKYPQRTRTFARTARLPQDVIKLYTRKARESFRTRNTEAL